MNCFDMNVSGIMVTISSTLIMKSAHQIFGNFDGGLTDCHFAAFDLQALESMLKMSIPSIAPY